MWVVWERGERRERVGRSSARSLVDCCRLQDGHIYSYLLKLNHFLWLLNDLRGYTSNVVYTLYLALIPFPFFHFQLDLSPTSRVMFQLLSALLFKLTWLNWLSFVLVFHEFLAQPRVVEDKIWWAPLKTSRGGDRNTIRRTERRNRDFQFSGCCGNKSRSTGSCYRAAPTPTGAAMTHL